eukprot:TRINITY_DN7096_c0_g1_i1.p1 TRINITY_DN7096_c0_g1~~TRINITY_DN7096_c0_g1_i1.p1  ORF type:complete len:376 (-),score=91.55 TRINITY_DN7096_c0_g1_i1:333-1460(-)
MEIQDYIHLYPTISAIHRGEAVPMTKVVGKEVEPKPEHYDYLERNNIPRYGTKYYIYVNRPSDLLRSFVKTDAASIFIPQIQFEHPAGIGRQATVEQLLDEISDSLEASAQFITAGPAHTQLHKTMDDLCSLKTGNIPFTVIINDPTSGSEVEEYLSDSITGKISQIRTVQTWDQLEEFDLLPEKQAREDIDIELNRVLSLIQSANRIVGLTGAGISTESGIPAYRNLEGDGIWNVFSVQDDEIHNFLSNEQSRINHWKMKRKLHDFIIKAKPNNAHIFFKHMHDMGKLSCLITQNIDGLHEVAGVPKEKIIEIHGNTNVAACMNKPCDFSTETWKVYKDMDEKETQVPTCPLCGGLLHVTTISCMFYFYFYFKK